MQTLNELIDRVRQVPGVSIHEPSTGLIDSPWIADVVPAALTRLYRTSNGMEAFHGYYRLFGLGVTDHIDAIEWNHPDTWKFAWNGRCDRYWCFGETALGDQYALDLESTSNESVCVLEATTMNQLNSYPSIECFIDQEWLPNAACPRHEMIKAAFERMGPISSNENLVFSPSRTIGGSDDLDRAMKVMPRLAMTIEGDLRTQVDAARSDHKVVGVRSYQDDQGRLRIRIDWQT